MAYDLLKECMPNRGDRRYLQILELAAKEGEARVEDALRRLLSSERARTGRSCRCSGLLAEIRKLAERN